MNSCVPFSPACNCHGHAHDCFYDPEVDRRNASRNQDNVYQGGGVCIDCQVGGGRPACGGSEDGSGALGWVAVRGGVSLHSVTPSHPSITPLASTVSAACLASTGPRTTLSTLPTLAAVSGVGPGGGPLHCSGRPGLALTSLPTPGRQSLAWPGAGPGLGVS